MSSDREIKAVDIEEIPEVLEYLDAHTRLEEFKARNPEFVKELEARVEEYNTALENADKAVRQRGVNCGPWEQLTPQVKYDAERLYSAVGREEFVKLGGIVKTVTEYSVDRPMLEAAIAQNRLPKQLVDVVRTVTRKYKGLPKGELP